MAVIDGQQARGAIKETHLPLEGFYEAITRMSALKALPTTAELRSSGYESACDFVIALREGDPEGLVAFLDSSANHAEWGGEARGEAVDVRLDHLIRLMIGTIEAQLDKPKADQNGRLSEYEVKKWMGREMISGAVSKSR